MAIATWFAHVRQWKNTLKLQTNRSGKSVKNVSSD
jgi:hypothetical protein